LSNWDVNHELDEKGRRILRGSARVEHLSLTEKKKAFREKGGKGRSVDPMICGSVLDQKKRCEKQDLPGKRKWGKKRGNADDGPKKGTGRKKLIGADGR